MAEVKWIKMKVGMFDGESFKKIKRAEIGGKSFRDKLTAIWFEILDLAGKGNCGGMLANNRELAYSELEDIAVMLDRKKSEIEVCLAFFIKEGMIEIIDNVYYIANWDKYQNSVSLEKIREQTKNRVARYRYEKRLLEGNANCNVTVTQCNADVTHLDIDKEIDIRERDNNLQVSKKEINNNYIPTAPAREGIESYDEIFDDMEVSGVLKNAYIEFIRHCQLNGKKVTNAKLKNLIIKLDFTHRGDTAKIESLQAAINGGYFDIKENHN